MAEKMKHVLLAISASLLMVTVGYCQTQPLQLTLQSDKRVYEAGEDIFLDYEMKNAGKEAITIAPPFDEYGVINPTSFGGSFFIDSESLKMSSQVFPLADIYPGLMSPHSVITLLPGNVYKRKVNIIRISQDSVLKDIRYSSTDFMRIKGKYKITGRYEWTDVRKDYPTASCWHGALVSNPITIEIVEKKQENSGKNSGDTILNSPK